MINKKRIGIALIAVSILIFAVLSTQTKVNINSMTNDDIMQACDDIDGLGDVTAYELINSKPVEDIGDIYGKSYVGDKKIEILKSHFTTHDTMCFGIFVCGLFLAIAFSTVGSVLITYHIEKIKADEENKIMREYLSDMSNEQYKAAFDIYNSYVAECKARAYTEVYGN